LQYFGDLARLVINSLYKVLSETYAQKKQLREELARLEKIYPSLFGAFNYWLMKYSDIDLAERKKTKFENTIVYDISSERDYKLAVLHYISSMTDQFAMKMFGELTRF
jgi:dGTPase